MFRNHLAGILDAKDVVQYNFVLTNETSSNTTADTELHQVMIKKESGPVKRIVIWYDQHMALLRGIQLFDKEGEKLLETGCPKNQFKSQETILEDDERIVGFKARKQND